MGGTEENDVTAAVRVNQTDVITRRIVADVLTVSPELAAVLDALRAEAELPAFTADDYARLGVL